MTTIKLDVDDRLIKELGLKTVNNFMKSQLDYLRLRYLGERIQDAIQKSGIDHKKELEEAREDAWQEYKETHLKDTV